MRPSGWRTVISLAPQWVSSNPVTTSTAGSRWNPSTSRTFNTGGGTRAEIYRLVNVTWVTPVGVLTASTSKRSSSPSSPSQSRSPRPRTMGVITMCM
jgi:hypothetical protein